MALLFNQALIFIHLKISQLIIHFFWWRASYFFSSVWIIGGLEHPEDRSFRVTTGQIVLL